MVYAIKDQTGQWWLMNSDGRVVEQGNNAKVANNTQVLGVALQDPVPNERGVALESAPAAEEEKAPAKKAAKKSADKAEEAEGEEKPAKKTAKKSTKKDAE